jgi:hypothetical protein
MFNFEEVPKKVNYGTESSNDRRTWVSIGDIQDDYGISKQIIIDNVHDRYPYCIVWTPLPVISWIIPLIGHTGICT